jgi:pyruvate-formate lyase-activating enzyme
MSPYDASPAQVPGPLKDAAPLVDGFGRKVSYLRLSVTDRCDLRCVYCMAEQMIFLPKAELLTLEELDRVATAFVALGTRKLRITGGEPLVRKGVMDLIRSLGRHLATGTLEEITLTTNGTRLAEFAGQLAEAGVKRINVSLDSLKPDLFKRLTRGGDVAKVLAGIEAAQAAGLRVKVNAVALAHDNAAEIPELIGWAHRPVPVAGDGPARAGKLLDPDRPAALDRRTGALCAGRTDRRPTGIHHPAQPQFLRDLQPRPADLHRHPAHLPGPGGRHRPARGAARRRLRRRIGRGHPQRRPGQAQGPRLQDRPRRGSRGVAPHVDHRRLSHGPRSPLRPPARHRRLA